MGIFDKMFGQKESSKETPKQAPNPKTMIRFYDKFGREFQITKDEWLNKVLPKNLKDNWNNSDALYDNIAIAVNDGFFKEITSATERLVQIDKNSKRSLMARAIVLMGNQLFDKAEQVLKDAINLYGEDGFILTNLAKIYDRTDKAKSEETLWKALKLNPNQDNAMEWWVALQRERGGEDAYLNGLENLSKISGSWKAQLWLADSCLKRKDIEKAKQYYNDVINIAKDQPVALMTISGDLGKNGYIQEAINIVAPHYDPAKHGFATGFNLLQAYYETKDFKKAKELLAILFGLNRPDIKQHLLSFEEKINKAMDGTTNTQTSKNTHLSAEAIGIRRPLWGNGFSNADWFIPKKESKTKIAFFALANTAARATTNGPEKEDIPGKLSRAIPLFLAEAFYCNTNAASVAYILLMKDPQCYILLGKEDPIELLCKMLKNEPDIRFVVGGSVEVVGDNIRLSIKLWDRTSMKLLKVFEKSSGLKDIGKALLPLRHELIEFMKSNYGVLEESFIPYYSVPSEKWMPNCLTSYSQLLTVVLAGEKVLGKESLYGQFGMFDYLFDYVLNAKTDTAAKFVFLAAIANVKKYDEQIFAGFKDNVIKLLEDERNVKSELYKLSPLFYKLCGMSDLFMARKAELSIGADDGYKKWLDSLV